MDVGVDAHYHASSDLSVGYSVPIPCTVTPTLTSTPTESAAGFLKYDSPAADVSEFCSLESRVVVRYFVDGESAVESGEWRLRVVAADVDAASGVQWRVADDAGSLPQVCVLDGGELPYIIRQASAGLHQFIGSCYVHWLMEREAYNGDPAESIELHFS